MGALFSKENKETQQRKTDDVLRIENEEKEKVETYEKKVEEGKEKVKRENQLLVIVTDKMKKETELKKHTIDKVVEFASKMQQNGQRPEDFHRMFTGILNASEKIQFQTESKPNNQLREF